MEYVSAVPELNYMSQIVIMLYEDPTKDPASEERFHVELHFSPGVVCCVQNNLPKGPGFRPQSRGNVGSRTRTLTLSTPSPSAHRSQRTMQIHQPVVSGRMRLAPQVYEEISTRKQPKLQFGTDVTMVTSRTSRGMQSRARSHHNSQRQP